MMTNNVFGLDLGAKTIKAVWVDKLDKGGYGLNAAFSAPMPEKGLSSESPLDLQQVAQAVGHVLSEAHISAKNVNIALPESKVFTKVVQTPVLSDKELSSAIYYIAEQQIPIPLKTVTLDYRVIKRPLPGDTKTTMDVLLVGAPTTLIDKYEQVLSLIGLTIFSVETESLSTIRALTHADDQAHLLLNIGTMSSSLALTHGSDLQVVYSIPTGGMTLTRAIATDLGITVQQAEEYKKTYGIAHSDASGKIGKSAEPILSVMVTEIKKASTFLLERFPGSSIGSLIVSGGSAKLPGLSEFLSARTNITTEIGNPWGNISNKDLPKELLEDGPEYTIAMGLAMRDYE